MITSEQYLTYSEYTALGGTLIAQAPFNLLEYNARKIIDKYTFNRFIDATKPEELKVCMLKLMELLTSYEKSLTQNKAVSSENIDGYSVTYNNNGKLVIDAKNNEIKDILSTYLSNTKINEVYVLYRGTDANK